MIQYTLMDTEIRVGLETAFPNFDRDLQDACKKEFYDLSDYVRVTITDSKDIFVGRKVLINKNAICAKKVFDPNKWNNYPEVTPPGGVLMRAEGHYAKRPGLKYYGALVYFEGAWHFADTSEIADNVVVERFRLWDDEEDAK